MSATTNALPIVTEPDFHKRVMLLLAKTCVDVLAEANTTPNHNQRATYAVRALNDLRAESQRAAFVLASVNLDRLVGAGSHQDWTDGQLLNGLSAVFNALAGVFEPEPETA